MRPPSLDETPFPFPREAIGPQVLPAPRPVSVGKPRPGANKLKLFRDELTLPTLPE